jgi:hypothetical protein
MFVPAGSYRGNLCTGLFTHYKREGSEIGRQIVQALLERRVKTFFVTHMYDLAGTLHDKGIRGAEFLRAERLDDGTRTFKVMTGAPLRTSYGKDLYEEIFPAQTRDPLSRHKWADHSDQSPMVGATEA